MRPYLTPCNAAKFRPALEHLAKHREGIFIPCPERMKPRTLSTAIREALVWFASHPDRAPALANLRGNVRVKTTKAGAEVDIWDRLSGEYSARISFRPLKP